MEITHIRIVGSGLIGSSIGLGLVQRGVAVTMIDSDPRAQKLAEDLVKSRSDRDPDIVLFATPLGSLTEAIRGQMASPVKYGFMDISSVKTKVKAEVQALGVEPSQFLFTHPMAGREVGGVESARADLFNARPWIIDSSAANAELRSAGVALIELLGAIPIEMDSGDHDQAVALVSHLPQLVASLLAKQLLAADSQWLELAGSGLRDTVRIAGSNPDLWREIIAANNKAIVPLLQGFIEDATQVLTKIADEGAIAQIIEDGNKGRERIPGKHGGQARNYSYLPIVIEDKPGQLAKLFDECAVADVNVEDLTIEHSPGQFTGLITLALSEMDAAKLSQHLMKKGWSVHSPR